MTLTIRVSLRNRVGTVLEVNVDEGGKRIGCFIRVRVCSNVRPPLKRGVMIRLGTQCEVFSTDFKYIKQNPRGLFSVRFMNSRPSR